MPQPTYDMTPEDRRLIAVKSSDRWLDRMYRFHPEKATDDFRLTRYVPMDDKIEYPLPKYPPLSDDAFQREERTFFIYPSVSTIYKEVSRQTGISLHHMMSKRRDRPTVRARQIVMYCAKRATLKSYPEIGNRMGGLDHTTVLAGARRIEGLLGTNPVIAAQVDAVMVRVKPRYSEAAE